MTEADFSFLFTSIFYSINKADIEELVVPSFKLPHPITVAVRPAYDLEPVGKHTGRIVLVKVTGESNVKMATSLY